MSTTTRRTNLRGRRCELIEDKCVLNTSLTLPLLSAFLAYKRLFQNRPYSALSKHQQGSLPTTSANLCYHLPRVYQLDTRTGYEPRERGTHITGSLGRRFWRLTAGYCCEGCLLHHRWRDCEDTGGYVPKTKREINKVKTRLSKTEHLLLLRYLYGSRASACTARIHEGASASVR